MKVKGRVSLPGDKSISHRAALFSAIKPGASRFFNFNTNNDCISTVNCLRAMGLDITLKGTELKVKGRETDQWRAPQRPLDAGNSGTTSRLISGILSALPFPATMIGDSSLSKRPMARVIEPLSRMGANINSTNNKLPMTFEPVESLKAIDYDLPLASAQVKSAVLLAGLFAQGQTRVFESEPSRDHTERMLGLPQERIGIRNIISSSQQQVIPDLDMTIPGDISSAAFFMCAACALPDSELVLENVSLNPSRTGIITVLQKMGAVLEIEQTQDKPEPAGNIVVRAAQIKNRPIEEGLIANIIDEIPILAVLATQAEGTLSIRNAAELRVKESDRINSIVENLKRCDVEIEEFEDGFSLEGPQQLKPAKIKTYGDHRIAMAFTIAGLFADGKIEVDDPECAGVSFPGFYNTLKQITHG